MITLQSPQQSIHGAITLSGSKSLSNRLLIMNALSGRNIQLHNLSDSEDTQLLRKALTQIDEATDFSIDVGHAGTNLRFLTALLSVTPGKWIIDGSKRIQERPLRELVDALKTLGASIEYLDQDGFAPLSIQGKKLIGGEVDIDADVSSQFISALLMIAPSLKEGLRLNMKGEIVSRPYIQMTLQLLKNAGASIEEKGNTLFVAPALMEPAPTDHLFIESDWSSASYWYSFCALSKNNCSIELRHLAKKSLQADAVLPELFKELGVSTVFRDQSIVLSSSEKTFQEFNCDFTNCPDIAQTIAVTCFGLGINARLTGLSTLKGKETDRIFALKTELDKLGAQVEAGPDWMTINGAALNSTVPQHCISTFNDHRMAMSFAPLALLFGRLEFDDPSVVDKSYPAFWEDLKSVGFSVNLLP